MPRAPRCARAGWVKVVVRIERAAGDHQGRAGALGEAGGDQACFGLRETSGERGEREEAETAEEDTAAADQVGGTAAEEQEAAVGEHIAADDPLQVLGRETQVVLIEGRATLTIETSRKSRN